MDVVIQRTAEALNENDQEKAVENNERSYFDAMHCAYCTLRLLVTRLNENSFKGDIDNGL